MLSLHFDFLFYYFTIDGLRTVGLADRPEIRVVFWQCVPVFRHSTEHYITYTGVIPAGFERYVWYSDIMACVTGNNLQWLFWLHTLRFSLLCTMWWNGSMNFRGIVLENGNDCFTTIMIVSLFFIYFFAYSVYIKYL